ncbi:MAG TPA: MaoC family dehydratase [Chloroflexota bacterium]
MAEADFAVARERRALEDFVEGAVYEYGPISFSADEMVEFARRYDPQLMHTDPEYAEAGPYGGLIASGWQTASMMMRLVVDHYLPTTASIGSPGVDELRWHRPVRPGDALRLRITVLEVRPSQSKPDRGILRSKWEALNQCDELVLSLAGVNFILTRAALAESA